MKGEGKAAVGRRDFLRILGSGVGVAAGASALAPSAQADSEVDSEKRKPRYRETEHVKAFYRVNRYPTKG
ncbi:MAG TPA: formate dehydrogenase [Hyphomicrobiaceae bacterium]|nr:formate dehydrogenase [Hyphomicrobiaceae bacterium]